MRNSLVALFLFCASLSPLAADALSDGIRADLARERRRLAAAARTLAETTRRLESALAQVSSGARSVADGTSRSDIGADGVARGERVLPRVEHEPSPGGPRGRAPPVDRAPRSRARDEEGPGRPLRALDDSSRSRGTERGVPDDTRRHDRGRRVLARRRLLRIPAGDARQRPPEDRTGGLEARLFRRLLRPPREGWPVHHGNLAGDDVRDRDAGVGPLE